MQTYAISTKSHFVTMLLGTWLVLGIFIDGYAHNHDVVETFFTPWHAILYSGFLACAAWILGMIVYVKKEWAARGSKPFLVDMSLACLASSSFLQAA